MKYPQLVQVDPLRIKFNPANPRQHQGREYIRLKKSVKAVGIVQMPTVRVMAGGFYECIDGEGRVLAAQEEQLPLIWVVSMGIISDAEAQLMLQAANAVREFNYLAECRGLANLHRQGMSIPTLATKFAMPVAVLADMIALGYFPDEIASTIQPDMLHSEEQARRWTPTLLTEILPLRQECPDQRHVEPLPLETLYDCAEVRQAVERVIAGEITNTIQMHAYVAQRRLELYQQRFDQDLQHRLEVEVSQAKQTLEDATRTQAEQEYQAQIAILQQQLTDLEKRYHTIIRDVAKRPEVVAQREQELEEHIAAIERERVQLQDDMRRQLEIERAQQQAVLDQQYASTSRW